LIEQASLPHSADGLGFTPREYSSLLNQLTAEAKINADYYSIGKIIPHSLKTAEGFT
jgi:hypothetical protein